MKIKAIHLSFLFITGFLLAVNAISAQNFGKTVLKKFEQIDSSGTQNGCQLILFSDQSFVNTGIFKDLANQEVFLWYAFGKWVDTNGTISCSSDKTSFKNEDLIAEIKLSYKKRKDYRLIDTYYEFVNEKYKAYTFRIQQLQLLDTEKGISYKEVQ